MVFQLLLHLCLKMKTKITFKYIALMLSLLSIYGLQLNAQNSYNVNYRTLVFLAANKVHKVGTDGSAAGNKTLYTNVITVGSQQIDCIVTTVSISNGSFSLPSSPASGTIPFDYSSTSGSGMSANEDSFFSPTMTWSSGGGNARFNFQFIAGGSYNNSTNAGTNVILQNVFVNTYDVDGNGGTSSHQFNSFGGFSSTQYQTATGGYIQSIFDFSVNKTKFRSTTNTNITNVTDDKTRVKVYYSSLSSFDFQVGAEGSGPAYYFLDFGQGPAWTNAPSVIYPPSIDLDPSTSSTDKSTDITNCNQSVKFAFNGTNVNASANIDTIYLKFATADILDGSSEQLLIDSASSGGTISLDFANNASIANVVLKGSTYNVKAIVASGESKLLFYKSGTTMTATETENLVTAFTYVNTDCSTLSLATRSFYLNIYQIPFISNTVQFDLNIIVPLPVKFTDFKGARSMNGDVLTWTVAEDADALYYVVQGSKDALQFETLARVSALRTDLALTNYQELIAPANSKTYYRILAQKANNQAVISAVIYLQSSEKPSDFVVSPNPMQQSEQAISLLGNSSFDGEVIIVNQQGQIVHRQTFNGLTPNIELSKSLSPGLYTIQCVSDNTIVKAIKWQIVE